MNICEFWKTRAFPEHGQPLHLAHPQHKGNIQPVEASQLKFLNISFDEETTFAQLLRQVSGD
jgi:hypothetical protein